MTNREEVLSALRHAAVSLDDDELARRAGIAPRQTMSGICRQLESEGLISRVSGPQGKIVNALRVAADSVPDRSPTAASTEDGRSAVGSMLPPGDSTEQQRAERAMLDVLGLRLGLALNPRRLECPGGIRVEVDGADGPDGPDDSPTVLVECFAHQGPAKGGQKYKLVNDALKLHWIASTMSPPPRLILCVTDEAAIRHLQGRSWQGQAIRQLGVQFEIVELPPKLRSDVEAAQRRQFR